MSILYFQVAIITEGGSELYIGSTVGPVAAYVGVSVEHEAHLRLMRDNYSRPLHVGIAPAVAVIRSASEDEHGGLTLGEGKGDKDGGVVTGENGANIRSCEHPSRASPGQVSPTLIGPLGAIGHDERDFDYAVSIALVADGGCRLYSGDELNIVHLDGGFRGVVIL